MCNLEPHRPAVSLNHFEDKILESNLRLPHKFSLGLARVPLQDVHLHGPIQRSSANSSLLLGKLLHDSGNPLPSGHSRVPSPTGDHPASRGSFSKPPHSTKR